MDMAPPHQVRRTVGRFRRAFAVRMLPYSSLGFTFVFFGGVILACVITLFPWTPPVSAQTTTFSAGLGLAVGTTMAFLLAAFPLLAAPGTRAITEDASPRDEAGHLGAYSVGPFLLSLFFMAVSGPVLLGSVTLTESESRVGTAFVLIVALGLPLLVTWSLFALGLALHESPLVHDLPEEGIKVLRVGRQRGLAVVPAGILITVLLVWVAVLPPSLPAITVDGRFLDWGAIPSNLFPVNGTTVRVAGAIAAYEFARNGTYPVSLVLADASHNLAFWNGSIPIPNRLPNPSFQTQVNNLTAFFDASASLDPDGAIAVWTWSFGDGTTGTGIRTNHTYPWSGNFTVTLRVVDNEGGASQTDSLIRVSGPEVPPFAIVETSVLGYSVRADGSGSFDPDGTVVNYTWSWGDGAFGYGTLADHTYASAGNYTLALQARDDAGLAASRSTAVRVPNLAPVPRFTTTTFYSYATFNATSSYDPDGSLVDYGWAFGDGGSATGPLVNHPYALSGNYTVVLSVSDNQGASASLVGSIEALPSPQALPPEVRLNVRQTGLIVTANGNGSFDPEGAPLSYMWAFGDGGTATGKMVEHLYAAPGAYVLALKVSTSDGRTTDRSVQLSLRDNTTDTTPPQAVVKVTVSQNVVTLDASDSTDSDGGPLSATWIIHDVRPDLEFVTAKGVTSADRFFAYFELAGVPLTPTGLYRVLLDTGASAGLVRDGRVYSYELVLDPSAPNRASLLRFAGGAHGFDAWATIGSVPAATDGSQWEVGVFLSSLLRPPSIRFMVESILGSVVVEAAPPVSPFIV